MISNQTFFNKVKKHLLKQMRKCKTGDMCAIMSPKDGTRCAIGGALPKKVARHLFYNGANNADVDSLYSWGEIEKYLPVSDNLASALQGCHDDFPVSRWKQTLTNIARKFKLKP
jgi:hypothetical protein